MPHPLSHKYPIPISQLCLVNTDVPAGVGAPPLDTTSVSNTDELDEMVAKRKLTEECESVSAAALTESAIIRCVASVLPMKPGKHVNIFEGKLTDRSKTM